MPTRKEMKSRAKAVVRRHYWLLLVICLVSAAIGEGLNDSLSFIRQTNAEYSAAEDNAGVMSSGTVDSSLSLVLGTLFSGDIDKSEEYAEDVKEQKEAAASDNAVLGRTRGVLAKFVNGVSSGEIFVSIVSSLQKVGLSSNIALILFFAGAAIIVIFIWYIFINMYKAVKVRIFLEGRVYEDMPVTRVMFFRKVKRWMSVAKVMFVKFVYHLLWSFTIIGGIIKKYSYFAVPYIIAENPSLEPNEAITLSRKMMDGHKWDCFVLLLSFIPWELLGIVTLGVANVFYIDEYEEAAYAEFYAEIRKLAKQSKIEGSELLNDDYLFAPADADKLARAYADIEALESSIDTSIQLTGWRGFIAKVFGITLYNRADEERYEENEENKLKVDALRSVIDGKSYPDRLFPDGTVSKEFKDKQIHFMRHYSVTSLILMFFIFSFVGWVWEVSLHLIQEGELVNRGVLHGPWLPIYGTGVILILVVLNLLRSKPRLEFIAAIVLCGCVEYFTAYYLEMTHNGQKWWDYSGYFLNLHGRICAEGLLVFGLGGLVVVYVIAPLLDNHLRKLSYKVLIPLCAVLLVVYTGDQIYSKKHPNVGKGVVEGYTDDSDSQTGNENEQQDETEQESKEEPAKAAMSIYKDARSSSL